MNSSDKINELQRQIEAEKYKIMNCIHNFNEDKYDPETVKEGYGSVQDGAGSDPHWSYTDYRDVEKPRWSRQCSKCGHKQYSYIQEAIISGYKPKF